MAKTIGEFHKEHAARFVEEKQVLVNILQNRVKWHQDQMLRTTAPAEQQWHVELILRDTDALEEVRQAHKRRVEFYKRQKITLQKIKFEKLAEDVKD